MILGLYAVLVGISLVLIIIGLNKPSESAQALTGFFFLFLLSLVILNGNLEYETGENITYTYNSGNLTNSMKLYTYDSFTGSDSKTIGYYMALGSGVGFIGVLFSLANTKWGKE